MRTLAGVGVGLGHVAIGAGVGCFRENLKVITEKIDAGVGIHTNRSKPTRCKFVGFILVGIKPASVSRLAPCVVCAVVVGQLMSNDKSDLILRLRDPEKSCIGYQPRRIRLYGQNLRPTNFTSDALAKPATCSRNNLLISDFTSDFEATMVMLPIEPGDKGLNFLWLRQMNAFCILPA